ncbi:hypothetical protein D3C78_1301020 [compost metagenome]
MPCAAQSFCKTGAEPSSSSNGQTEGDAALPCNTASRSFQIKVQTANLPLLASAIRLDRSVSTMSLWYCQPSTNIATGRSSVASSGQKTKSGLQGTTTASAAPRLTCNSKRQRRLPACN